MGVGIKSPEADRRLRRVAIVRRFHARPVLDNRTVDEILGYNKDGLFD
jgi:hypothetical protein